MNPIYQQYGRGNQPQNILQQFQQFRQNFSGNPQQIVQNMLNSGQITQEQVNRATQIANQLIRFIK
jgi:hypothetical protein